MCLHGKMKVSAKASVRSLLARDMVLLPLIMWTQPETGRSNPRQGEVPQPRDGGLQEVLGSTRSRDLGIEVKC